MTDASVNAAAVRRRWWALLGVIVVLGFVARVWNLDFDQRQHQHPDERHWTMTADALRQLPEPPPHGTVLGPALDWLDADRSPANAYRATESFVYGPAPLAWSQSAARWLSAGAVDGDQPASAVVHALDAVGIPLLDDDGVPRFDDGYQVDLVGRLLGAFADTLTIVVVALIGRRLAGRRAGLVGAALYASCVLAIQHAHYLGAEPFLGLTSALVVLAALRLDRSAQRGASARSGAVLGLAIGAAVAMKLTALSLVAVPLVGCVVLIVRHRRASDVLRLVSAVVGAYVAFRVLHPGAFDGLGFVPSHHFLDDSRLARELSTADIPPTIQWANRGFLQPFVWLFSFTLGPGLSVLATAGAVALGGWRRWRLVGRPGWWAVGITLAAVAVPMVVLSQQFVRTGRYVMPTVPTVCALGGIGVVAALRWARRAEWHWPVVIRVGVGGALGLSLLWGVAFVNGVYAGEHTRIEATAWIVDNVPAGSVVTNQAWDDALPLGLPGVDTSVYVQEQLEMVTPDSEAKIRRIADQLQRVDYVFESSPRLWDTAPRIPARFPSTIAFFEGLDDGTLGFERVATFDAEPSLGPFHWDDSWAEEAFSVYDHPEVRIWRKVEQVPVEDIVARLDPVAAVNALTIAAVDAHANGLLLDAGAVDVLADSPSYDEAFDTDGNGWVHAVGWLVLLELLGAAAFVLLLPVFGRLPDGGFGVSKTLALVLVAFATFVATTWLGLGVGRLLAAIVLSALVGAGVWSARRHRAQLAELWHHRRAALIGAEVVGLVAFAAVLALRAANPDLWHPARGGEKPFEMALLTAVLRSDTFAPYDPWFSGGVLNYYYGGWMLLSAPARLLRTPPALLMNVGLAVFASCIAGAAWTVGAALTDLGRRVAVGVRGVGRRTIIGAGLAVMLVLFTSNMDVISPAWTHLLGSANDFDWWARSRVIPNSVAITEFPAWSLLFGDLHPHLMGIAVLISVGVVGIVLFNHLAAGRRSAALVAAGLAGVLLGQVRATNTWDLLLAGSIVAVALIAAVAVRAPWRLVAGAAAIVGVIVVIVWSPYTRQSVVFDAGVEAAELHTEVVDWLEQFGLFVAVSLLALAGPVRRAVARSSRLVWRVRRGHLVTTGWILLAAGSALVWPDRAVAILAGTLAAALCWAAWRSRGRRHVAAFAPVVLAGGWAIQVFVELVTIRNDGGRQNTVFKFWYQSWLLLAIGSAAVLATTLPDLRRLTTRSRAERRTGTFAVAIVGVAVVVSTAFWAFSLPPRLDDRISTTGASLDGEDYLDVPFEVGVADVPVVPALDVPLVDWLRGHVDGVRVIAERTGDDYRWTSRFSWSTGLPTPIGWPYHESQQRRAYGSAIDRRRADMDALFTTTDPGVVSLVLADNRVAYVVYGTVEAAMSSPENAAVLRGHECLTVEFESDDLFIASVDAACVSATRPAGG